MDDACRRLLSECIQEANVLWDRWASILIAYPLMPADCWGEAVRIRVGLYQAAEDLESIQERYG